MEKQNICVEMTNKEYEAFYDEMVLEEQAQERLESENCEVC